MSRFSRNAAWTLGWAALAVLAAGGGAWLRRHRRTPPPPPQALCAFLEVGDGDCALLRTVDGTVILMDTGGKARAAKTVLALRRLHVRTIDLLVLAGPDDGSCGAVPDVLNAFPVRSVWDGASSGTGEARQAALSAIRRRHVPSRIARAGDNLQIGGATFWTAVWPAAGAAWGDRLVCRLDFGRTRFLLAGAADGPTENALLASGAAEMLGCGADAPCSDLVLQAGRQTSPEMLWQAAPAIAVVSCGAAAGQTPALSALARRVGASGAALWRTDTQGTIVVRTDGRAPPDVSAGLLK